MVPLLVEYSENDDTGCAVGLIVVTCAVIGVTLLTRLVTLRVRA